MKPSDIKIIEVNYHFDKFPYRTPLKFGGVVLESSTIFNVSIRVKTRKGKEAVGNGAMPLGAGWSFPSDELSHKEVEEIIYKLDKRIISVTEDCQDFAHPVELAVNLKEQYLKEAKDLSDELNLSESIPKLCTLVASSPIDAALHDGFGKANEINCYNGYSRDYLSKDLSHYLDDRFEGEFLDKYTLREPKLRIPLYHLVGALDPLVESDIAERLNDGLPETLSEWIIADGITHLKIKLTGEDLDWDVERLLSIDRVTEETQRKQGVENWYYSADFNEKCENVEYLLAFLNQVKEDSPQAFNKIQYIEQPTSRYLEENRDKKMHAAAELKPVVIDEALQDYESLLLAHEQGYSGAALKTCKGHTQALLMAAAALKFDMFLCVQDLTCPGLSFLHSAGMAARIPHVAAVEGNARQYCPDANEEWEDIYPGIFELEDGTVGTGILKEHGLGH